MKPNADEFIFHSNFGYNAPVIYGYKDFNNLPIPATVELVSGLQAGDRFKVVTETNGMSRTPGGPFPGMLNTYYMKDGKLFAPLTSQSPGQTFTGRIHYRVYRKSKDTIFSSKTRIEKVVFTKQGEIVTGGSPYSTIPNTYGKNLNLWGIWRVKPNGQWYTDGYSGGPPGSMGLASNATNIEIAFGMNNGTSPTIEYKIVGTDLYGI